jgi:hypothetical protein
MNGTQESGFVALISVLIIVAVSVIIGSTVALKSISHATMSLAEIQSAQAWASANGCVETAIAGLGNNSTSTWDMALGYPSQTPFDLSIGGITCHINHITATSSDYRLIQASSTVGTYVRKLEVIVATNTPQTNISSWQEVGDFSH